MDTLLLGVTTAVWFGILTSISPCPLATNIAAISFIGKRVGDPRRVFLSGLFYTFGRMLAYVALGILLVLSLLSIHGTSNFLQNHMNKLIGPILILVGMVLLELIPLSLPGGGPGEKTRRRAETAGIWGSAFLGIVFALSFCPVSAALFFGSLVPLATKHESLFLLPSLYGVGTALPVIVFAVMIALGVRSVGKLFDKLTQFEKWARYVTGAIFVLVGIYYCLVFIFGL